MYTQSFKEKILKRMLSPERATVWQLQQETGVNRSTLYAWQSKWKQEGVLSEVRASKQQREVGMSAQEKFHTVIETAHYNEAELSTYCRERGLYPEQVKQWQQGCLSGVEKLSQGEQTKPKLGELSKENRRLQAELKRKEKALAEAAALLILSKKAQAIWGESGEE